MGQGRKVHAVLVYARGNPVGWCQYGKCDELPRIDAGRGYKKVVAKLGTSGVLMRKEVSPTRHSG